MISLRDDDKPEFTLYCGMAKSTIPKMQTSSILKGITDEVPANQFVREFSCHKDTKARRNTKSPLCTFVSSCLCGDFLLLCILAIRTVAATGVAAIAAFQMIGAGKDHIFPLPVIIFAFD